MRLAQFITENVEPILREWESFARTCGSAGARMNSLSLRDHAAEILAAIVKDLTTHQTDEQQFLKSHGRAPIVLGAPETGAQIHAIFRAKSGFNVNQLVAEYRALRASVLKLWIESCGNATVHIEDMVRFNEAIDQAVAESLRRFEEHMERGRALMLGMLGHDMCSPLHAIRLAAVALTKTTKEHDLAKASEILVNSTESLQDLLNDLTDFNRTRLGSGIPINKQGCNLAELFRQEIDIQRTAFPNSTIKVIDTGNSECTCDGRRLRQVLRNLVVNAVKYGKRGSPIHVLLRGNSDTVTFDVINEWDGDPDELDDRLFLPLERGTDDDDRLGSCNIGLGLFISREIIRAHGGTIALKSDPGQIRVTVRLAKQPHPKE